MEQISNLFGVHMFIVDFNCAFKGFFIIKIMYLNVFKLYLIVGGCV